MLETARQRAAHLARRVYRTASTKPRVSQDLTRSFVSSRTEQHSPRSKKLLATSIVAASAIAAWAVSGRSASADSLEDTRDERSTLPLDTFPPPQHDTSDANIRGARDEFVALIGTNAISDNPAELKSRSSTPWSPSPVDRTASLIVYPLTTEDVSAIMKICHRRNIPVTPYSGGTSLDGALAATRGGVCIDFSRMNRILCVRPQDLDVTVQPGVGWQALNEALASDGLFFPVDPGPGAQIGGMIATGCSGTNAYRYGPMRDWVVSATIVLADGTIVRTRRRPRKSTAGYDLTRLMVSSSGTLGLVTEACLKLTAVPSNQRVAVVAFPSTTNAVDTVIDLIQRGVQTEALELMDANAMKAANESGYTSHGYREQPTLFVKFAGASSGAVDDQVGLVRDVASSHGSEAFESSADPETMSELWAARKTVLWSLLAQKKDEKDEFLSSDIAVPISRLSQIIDESRRQMADAGLLGTTLGHVGDANFHISIVHSPADRERAEAIIDSARRRGVEMEGTCTGEHGIGLALRDVLTEELGETGTDMMRRIKLALDPKCLLACDKVVRIERGPDH